MQVGVLGLSITTRMQKVKLHRSCCRAVTLNLWRSLFSSKFFPAKVTSQKVDQDIEFLLFRSLPSNKKGAQNFYLSAFWQD